MLNGKNFSVLFELLYLNRNWMLLLTENGSHSLLSFLQCSLGCKFLNLNFIWSQILFSFNGWISFQYFGKIAEKSVKTHGKHWELYSEFWDETLQVAWECGELRWHKVFSFELTGKSVASEIATWIECPLDRWPL